jgi:hypothetical protein
MKSRSCFLALVILLAACNASPVVETAVPTPQPPDALKPTATAASAAPEATATLAPAAAPSSTQAPAPTVAPTATPAKIQYKVQAGDTLIGLAKAYHTSIASIQITNAWATANHCAPGKRSTFHRPRFEGESAYWWFTSSKRATRWHHRASSGLTKRYCPRQRPQRPVPGSAGPKPGHPLDTFRVAQCRPRPRTRPRRPASPRRRLGRPGQPDCANKPTCADESGDGIPLATATTAAVPTATTGSVPPDVAAGQTWLSVSLMKSVRTSC